MMIKDQNESLINIKFSCYILILIITKNQIIFSMTQKHVWVFSLEYIHSYYIPIPLSAFDEL